MQTLIAIMIFAGSALMLYNIIRYAAFLKNRVELEQQNRQNGLLAAPLLLLIFFLIGYLAVGISGMADLIMASILFFGSVYVFLMLTVMFSIIRRIQDTEQVLSVRYEEMKEELDALMQDSLAVFQVNLTRDEVEARSGDYLYDTDLELDRYSQLLEERRKNVIDTDLSEENRIFTREGLLQHYQDGHTSVEAVRLVRLRDGNVSYVQLRATMTRKPASGDIVAFLVERRYDREMVSRFLMERVLMDRYDRIAFLIDGKYEVLISNDGKKTGLLLSADAGKTYEEVYLNYILPSMRWTQSDGPNPLRLSVIDKALAERDTYDVNAPFFIDGVTRYKHIVFYVVDRQAKYYLMLLSDSTAVQEEQTLRNRQLQEALDTAVRADEARTRFFTNISHDLRTPMNSILGFTQMARQETDPSKAQEYLDKVELSGRRLLGLLDDLFAMSLINVGKLELEEEPVDLAALAGQMQEQCCLEGYEKGIRVRTDTSGLREPRVLGDRMRLTQVVRRLMENACHYTPEGGEIRLSLAQTGEEDPAPGTYTVRIQSSGGPVPEEVRDQLFRLSGWTDSKSLNELPGVGLGMAVAKAYIDRMGGTVAVGTTAEGGAEFCIRLPLVSLPEGREADREQGKRAFSVLLVDDNEINREIGELILSGEGFAVDLACDGAEAVEKVSAAEAGTYDAVLMDVQMPVMNGYEATAAIRALEDREKAGIPVIALTANAYQEDAGAALAAGMDGYVTKPLEPEKIRAAIQKAMKKQSGR